MNLRHGSNALLIVILMAALWGCKDDNGGTPVDPNEKAVQIYTTSGNEVNLMFHKSQDIAQAKDERFEVIEVDTYTTYQTIEGFGYTLTGGSAQLLHQMSASNRAEVLQDLFGSDSGSIQVSYLRVSIGASDLDPVVFSYNDLPFGMTQDPTLQYFNLSRDTLHLLPVLKEILAIHPNILIMGSPWSAPVWMKTNGNSVGGSLRQQYYSTYAQYFVKYIQAMQQQGIRVDAITPQNEPQHDGNNPSMVMSSAEQADFIKNHLGPAFQSAGITTKIIIWDHNCDQPQYPIDILNDAGAKSFVHGSAFHLYGGDVSALSAVHDAHPDKSLYFTEQWTGSTSTFDGDLKWHIKNVIIGTMRNWSKVALEWNLASDPNFDPHTPGGCTQCKGALTISGNNVSKNVSYYIIGHASRFVPPGSVRIATNIPGNIHNVAFQRPDGKKVLIALNEGNAQEGFNIHDGNTWIHASLHAGTVGTFIW